MEPIATQLKRLRESAQPKISIRAMADELGMPSGSYAFYEDAKKSKKTALPLGLARQIAKVLGERGVDRTAVLALAGLDPVEAVAPALPSAQLRPALIQSDNVVTLRQIDVGLSMGDGTNLDDYIEEGTVEFDLAWLQTFTRAPAERVILGRGVGDSMFPTLFDNDAVLIDTTQTVLNQQDRVWAVSVYGAGGIKRLRKIGPALVEVMSDNERVGNREVPAEDVRIIGRVVGLARKL